MTDIDELRRVLRSYTIGGELGRGGFGAVFAGHHNGLDRPVAVKVLPPWFADDPDVRARFVREAQLLAKVDHPHIVSVYDYVEDGNLCALVMEYLAGGTLSSSRHPMDPGEVCAIGAAMCVALEHAHQRGITHRDVKPDNVMFRSDGVLKLTDFGLAKMVSGASSRSHLGLVGTPAFMAPEQVAGEEVGPLADVYSTALVLYELLAGELPFPSDGDALQVAAIRMIRDPVPLLLIAPQVPPPIAAVVMRALARAPSDRYASAEGFGVALAEAAVTAFGTGWVQRFDAQLSDLGHVYLVARDPLAVHSRASTAEDVGVDGAGHLERIVDEDVQFSVYRPRSVSPERWYELLTFAHKSEPTEDAHGRPIDPLHEVREQAEAHLGPAVADYRRSGADSELPLVPGSKLVFVPVMPGVEFEPLQRAFTWDEPVHKEVFRFRAGRDLDGLKAEGQLSVYLGALLIAEVGLRIPVTGDAAMPGVDHNAARPYRKIFASYSLRDLDVVSQVASYVSVFGDTYVTQASEYRSTGSWDDRLAGLIRDADVFQLFWSSNAMGEPFIQREWTYALSLRRPEFIRPVYWEEPLPSQPEAGLPPPELTRLSFQRLPVEPATVTLAPGQQATNQALLEPPGDVFPAPPSWPTLPHTSEAHTSSGASEGASFPLPGGTPGPPQGPPPGPSWPSPPPPVAKGGQSKRLVRLGAGAAAAVVAVTGFAVASDAFKGGEGSPSATFGVGAPSSTTSLATPPSTLPPTSVPAAALLALLIPREVNPSSCSEQVPTSATFPGVHDVVTELVCPIVPGLPGGRVTAYGFAGSDSYLRNLAAFNAGAGLDPSTATNRCPPPGRSPGRAPWSPKGASPGPGQVVECFVSAPGGLPLYLWTFPINNAFLVAEAGPGTPLVTLGRWWSTTVTA